MNDLYNVHDMEFVGWWVPGPISFSSSNSIGGIAYLKDWRFRTSSNLNYTVFSNLGSSPIIIDFNDIPNAIGTGVLNGAYAANLNEKGELALYDISNRESFPGFHFNQGFRLPRPPCRQAALPDPEIHFSARLPSKRSGPPF